jgi:hypothetical protein
MKRNYYTDEVVDTGLLSLPGSYIRDLVPRNRERGRVHLFVVQIGKFVDTGFKEYKLCICLRFLQTSVVASHSVNSEKLIEIRDPRSSFPKPDTWTGLSEKQCKSVASQKVKGEFIEFLNRSLESTSSLPAGKSGASPTRLHNSKLYGIFRINR